MIWYHLVWGYIPTYSFVYQNSINVYGVCGIGYRICEMVSVPKFTKNSTFEECIGVMSPVQRDMFILIDEYWKKFQYSPTLRELAYLRGKMGIGNTKRIVDQLVRIGAVKKVGKRGRTIRPIYINFRNLD